MSNLEKLYRAEVESTIECTSDVSHESTHEELTRYLATLRKHHSIVLRYFNEYLDGLHGDADKQAIDLLIEETVFLSSEINRCTDMLLSTMRSLSKLEENIIFDCLLHEQLKEESFEDRDESHIKRLDDLRKKFFNA